MTSMRPCPKMELLRGASAPEARKGEEVKMAQIRVTEFRLVNLTLGIQADIWGLPNNEAAVLKAAEKVDAKGGHTLQIVGRSVLREIIETGVHKGAYRDFMPSVEETVLRTVKAKKSKGQLTLA